MTGPTPKQSPDRCALRAEVRGDPMLGTAFPAGRILLVEQPGAWGPDGLTDSDFDERAAHELRDRTQHERIRVQLIRRPGRSDGDGERRWGLADCRPGRESLRWGTFTRDHELLDLTLDGTAGAPDPAAVYLVCTHGRHDVCCALRGRPTAAALAALRPGRVWETSHVGGDRFAANVLVLPAGLLYARIDAAEAARLIRAVETGTVLMDRLRGRVGLPAVSQAALAFAWQQLGTVDGVRVRAATPIESGHATVRLTAPGRDDEFVVGVRVETRSAAGLTCQNPRPNRYLAYSPYWVNDPLSPGVPSNPAQPR